MRLDTHYGKAEVSTYRTAARPLEGLPAIPESAFTGRPNDVLAADDRVIAVQLTVRDGVTLVRRR